MSTPTVVTNTVTVVSYSDVKLNGSLVSDGGSSIIEMGFCYNTIGNPTISDYTTTVLIGLGDYTADLGCRDIPEGIYYVKAFATNGDGTSYGEETTFSLSEEATQVQLTGQFYDINENLFKIKIYRPDHPADPEYTIKYSDGRQALTLNHGGGGKDSFENTVIQGQELLYNFYVPRSDVSYIEYLLESKYKDYVVILYQVQEEAEDEIFRGYLKPENLVKRYEQNPPYIEIQLSATDSLVELDYMEFKDSDDSLIISDSLTALQIIKKCLEKIEYPTSLGNLDFKIQLGTYESSESALMSSDECALDKITVDTHAFIEGEVEEEKTISCYQVIERLLKPFNVFFRQEKGYYVISNPHELDSYEFVFDWATLTQQSRTATTNLKDISSNYFIPYIEQQKIHPLKYGFVTHRNYIIAEELLSNDWNDWTGENWESSEIDDDGDLVVGYTNVHCDTDPDPVIYPSSAFAVAMGQTTDYLVFRFTYILTGWAPYSGSGRKGSLNWKIEIQGPDGVWRDPTYVEILINQLNYAIEVISSFSYPYRVTKSGNYNVRLSLHVEGGESGNGHNVALKLRNPSMKVYPLSDKAEVLASVKEPIYEDPHEPSPRRGGTSVRRSTVTGTRSVATRTGSVSGRRGSGRASDPGKDRTFKLEQPDGYETFEADLHFADGVTEDVKESGAFMIGGELTSQWNRYGESEDLILINTYVANVIDNRQKYKNYLRCTIIDRNHEINFTNILVIEDKNYFILQYFRDYRNGTLEAELSELLTDKIIYENEIEIVHKSSIVTVDSSIPALVYEGEYLPSHGFEVGDILRYSMNPGYTKAQADTPIHARAVSVVSEILTEDIFKHISDGHIRSDSTLYKALDDKYDLTNHKGEYYFLSPTVAGEICRADELDVYDIEQCVGFVTTKGFKIEIDAKNLERPPYPGISDMSITGNGMEVSPFTLVNDEDKPLPDHYYGTDSDGIKGFHPDKYITGATYDEETQIITITRSGELPDIQIPLNIFVDLSIQGDGTPSNPFTLVNDEDVPGILYVYGTNALGVKGWWPLYTEEESESESESQSTPIVPGILRDYYVTSMTFNTETRILTLKRSEGLSDLTVEIPGGETGLSEIPFEWCVILEEINTFTLDIYVTSGYTISKAVLEVDAGTLTDVTVKINSTAVTGISGVTVTTSRGVFTATANNVAVAEDRVSLIVDGASYTGEPVIIRGKIILA
jgi:hypothetical protein